MNMNIPHHSTVKLAVKGIIGIFAALMLIVMLVTTLGAVADNDYSVDDVDLINWCDGDYYDRDFASLHETLTLYDLYSEDYALYWEAVNGYDALVRCRQWVKAEEQGISGAGEHVQEALNTLKGLAASPQFPRNAGLLAGMYEQALAIAG